MVEERRNSRAGDRIAAWFIEQWGRRSAATVNAPDGPAGADHHAVVLAHQERPWPDLVAAALALFGVTALASRWAGAFLLDRCSPRGVLAAGLAATGAALIGLALAHGPAQVLIAIALVGLGLRAV
ncbi:hypothetical protein ITP53_17510 [Nonomuraea sp. K274]|uniref:Uncharacterized protein n=1 Tax=Nonomuraea cypriaca TaxID=1187855 RepID=A0A931A9J4_9ACTN|nr:hypothetical protein [Nonomuraea cypriaca]MBF8187500.1 hypothetical protein [Nonomuraea cypriaca]